MEKIIAISQFFRTVNVMQFMDTLRYNNSVQAFPEMGLCLNRSIS